LFNTITTNRASLYHLFSCRNVMELTMLFVGRKTTVCVKKNN